MATPSSTSPPPVILIHGAWMGAWAYDALLPRLNDAGLVARAIDLPGNGVDGRSARRATLETYVDCVRAHADELGGRVAVVGHSLGGFVATAFAEEYPEQVCAVIYLAGMCLPEGRQFGQVLKQLVEEGHEAGPAPHIERAADGLTLTMPPAQAIRYVFSDVPTKEAEAAAAKLTPQPVSGFFITSHTTAERFGRPSIKKLYVEARADRMLVLPAQRLMQTYVPGMPVISLGTGHVPQLTDPAGVAQALCSFLLQGVPPCPNELSMPEPKSKAEHGPALDAAEPEAPAGATPLLRRGSGARQSVHFAASGVSWLGRELGLAGVGVAAAMLTAAIVMRCRAAFISSLSSRLYSHPPDLKPH